MADWLLMVWSAHSIAATSSIVSNSTSPQVSCGEEPFLWRAATTPVKKWKIQMKILSQYSFKTFHGVFQQMLLKHFYMEIISFKRVKRDK